jgi:hypothetical protein
VNVSKLKGTTSSTLIRGCIRIQKYPTIRVGVFIHASGTGSLSNLK